MEPIEELHLTCPDNLKEVLVVITELTWAVSQLIAVHNEKVERENSNG